MHANNSTSPIELRFSALLDAAPDAMIMVDESGGILIANSHAERHFGCSRKQLIGARVERLLPERYRAEHVTHRERFHANAMARPMGGGRSRLYGQRADGNEFPVDISLSPVTIDGQKMVLAAIRDMTVRQHAEDKLRELSIALERMHAPRKLQDFARECHHRTRPYAASRNRCRRHRVGKRAAVSASAWL